MRVMLASLAALAAAGSLHTADAAAACPVSAGVLASAAYLSCQAATGAYLSDKAASVSVSPSVFCSNRDCYAVWNSLNNDKLLRCYQQYSVGSYSMKGDDGANCFKDYGGSATPTAATPTAAPPAASPVTAAPSVPTVSPTPAANSPSTPSNSDTGSTTTKPNSPSTNSGTTSNTSPSESSTSTVKPGSEGSAAGSPSSGTTGGTTGGTSDGDGAGGTEAGDSKTSTTTSGGTTTSEDDGSQGNASGTSKKTSSSSSATASESATTRDTNKSNGTGSGSHNAPGGSSDNRDDSTEADSSSVWVAAGSSIGGIVVIAFIFVYVRRRRDSSVNAQKLDGVDDAGYLPTLQDSHSRRSGNDSFAVMADIRYGGATVLSSRFAFGEDEVIAAARIPLEKLKRGVLISRGGYGEVYRGTYRDDVVAIKALLPARRNDMRQIENFLAEVKLMAALEHEHIVHFIGVAWDALNELCVVSEFMERGDLRTLLTEYAAKPRQFPKGFVNADKVKIALHVAHALTYMHSLQPMVLHRDLKSRNILLDKKLNAKITDFGISRERADNTMTIGVGSSLWMAPEVMVGGRYDEKADVFSFGVVLSELDTHTLPYSHALEPGTGRKLPDTVVVQMMTTGRINVEFTVESPMAQLGRRCVLLDPKERPSAAEAQHQIHQMSRTSR